MSTAHARRVRIVGVVVAAVAAWIGGSACAKKEAAPNADASRDAAGAVAGVAESAQAKLAPPDPQEACYHYDGSEYRCPGAADRALMLSSGTVIDSGWVTLHTAGGEKKVSLPPGTRLDAVFLTPKGVKLLEDHYRYDRPQRPEHRRRADSLATFIATFSEP